MNSCLLKYPIREAPIFHASKSTWQPPMQPSKYVRVSRASPEGWLPYIGPVVGRIKRGGASLITFLEEGSTFRSLQSFSTPAIQMSFCDCNLGPEEPAIS